MLNINSLKLSFKRACSINFLKKNKINFSTSSEEQQKFDLQTKNTHLNVDLDDPFKDEKIDFQKTEWRRHWNIKDSPKYKERMGFIII